MLANWGIGVAWPGSWLGNPPAPGDRLPSLISTA